MTDVSEVLAQALKGLRFLINVRVIMYGDPQRGRIFIDCVQSYPVKDLIVRGEMLCVVIVGGAQERPEGVDISNSMIFEGFVENSNDTEVINILLKEDLQSPLSPGISVGSLEYPCSYTARLIYLMLDRTRRSGLRNMAVWLDGASWRMSSGSIL